MKIHIEVTNDAAMVQVVRRTVTSMLKTLGASKGRIEEAALLVGEACGNVVRHAYDEPSKYEVDLEIQASHLMLNIQGHGKGFDPSTDPGRACIGISIMSAIGPNLRIESTRGKGTLISVRIPLEVMTDSS